MDKRKMMELAILITISQNKKVASWDFHHLFEDEWKDYILKFDEMQPEGLFEIVFPIPGTTISIYELTDKGKIRMTDLLEEREGEIGLLLTQLNQTNSVTRPGWKAVLAHLNSMLDENVPSATGTKPQLQSDYSKIKAWLQSRLTGKETVKS